MIHVLRRELLSNKLALLCFIFVFFVLLLSLLAPVVCRFDPNEINLVDGKLLPPFSKLPDGKFYFFGTDSTGRDMFSRIIFGARLSLIMGVVPTLIAFLLGVPLGLLSGYAGGKIDQFLMRFNDLMLAFPSILIALIVVSFLGQGIENLMIAVGLSYVPTFARFVRGVVVSEASREYVKSAVALGAGHVRVMLKHIAPNSFGPILVISTMNFASALLESAGLSFLGLGIQPPTPEWGSILAEGKNYFYDGWWVIVFPGVAIFLTVLSLNILGETFRDSIGRT
jgi:peptide/nickel transport system permease protein